VDTLCDMVSSVLRGCLYCKSMNVNEYIFKELLGLTLFRAMHCIG
jgi:hypothetical protein